MLTLLSLQECPAPLDPHGTLRPRLIAPAAYVEAEWNNTRCEEEKVAIKRLLGKRGEYQKLWDKLAADNWSYDLVLRVQHFDERIHNSREGSLCVNVKALGLSNTSSSAYSRWGVCEPDLDQQDAVLKNCICLPWLPPAARLSDEEACVVYLIARDESRLLLRRLQTLWNSPVARNVLIAAAPGSGKEVVARLIHHGRARGPFVVTSAGGQQWATWQVPLLGWGQIGGPAVFSGFVEAARGGTIFIDEIDKADEDIRAGLLRVIEADEFHRPGSWEHVRLSKEHRPLFLFAASGEGPGAREARKEDKSTKPFGVVQAIKMEAPKDFWQRISSVVEFDHPLGTEDGWEKTVLREYVVLFMRRSRCRYESVGSLHSPYATNRLLAIASTSVWARVTPKWSAAVTSLFLALLKHQGSSRPGLRLVRSASEALVGWMFDQAQTGNLPDDLTDSAEAALKSAIGQ